ncbi:hypothetical protein EAG_11033 [Camponotus floridanus]|uniref:Uncharacterized protein n=1 Tax=Camponotus floridanus TaxID=104421 RepID=E2AJ99_CAMFO|nr:hypothetical protein EAG_11033 [Camponotus floridanus]
MAEFASELRLTVAGIGPICAGKNSKTAADVCQYTLVIVFPRNLLSIRESERRGGLELDYHERRISDEGDVESSISLPVFPFPSICRAPRQRLRFTDDVPVRREAVLATALGRLTAQPDRPIARLLLPSAILPLPEHKDAAEPSVAERRRKRPIVACPVSIPLPPTPPPPPPPPLPPRHHPTTVTPAAMDRRAFCGFAPSSVS